MHTHKHIFITRSSFFPCPGETQSLILVSPSFHVGYCRWHQMWFWPVCLFEPGILPLPLLGGRWCSGSHVGFGSREIRVWEEKPGSWLTFRQASDFLSAKWFLWRLEMIQVIHLLGRHSSLPLVWKDADFCRVAFLIVKKLTHAWGFLPSRVGISIQPRSEFTS